VRVCRNRSKSGMASGRTGSEPAATHLSLTSNEEKQTKKEEKGKWLRKSSRGLQGKEDSQKKKSLEVCADEEKYQKIEPTETGTNKSTGVRKDRTEDKGKASKGEISGRGGQNCLYWKKVRSRSFGRETKFVGR